MRSCARTLAYALVLCAVAMLTPAAALAAFGVQEKNFEAGTCAVESCTYASIEKEKAEKKPSDAYTQAAGHPEFGLTVFTVNSKEALLKQLEPEGAVRNIRVDVPPGVAADPQALPECKKKEFEEDKCAADTEVGVDELTVFAKALDTELKAPVYNLEPPEGLPLEFGIHAEVKGLANEHVFLKGHLSWHAEARLQARGIPSGDYHEYFEINEVNNENPVLKSKLIFKGRVAAPKPYSGEFLTLPSVCSTSTTSYLELESWTGEIARAKTVTPVGVEGCETVPFKPTVAIDPETIQSDETDGPTVEVRLPQGAGQTEVGSADLSAARVTLPEGMTLDPSAAQGLETCTAAEIAIGTESPVSCPSGSKVGTVAIETPDLPPGSLVGGAYLGSPTGAVITGPPFTLYVAVQSARHGVAVRLAGVVNPNPVTGRLETTFSENPELPFSDFVVKLNGGPLAPLANPLSCEAGQIEALFLPFTDGAAAQSAGAFSAGGCPTPLPFALGQSTADQPALAGAHAAYTFNLARQDGQQYLSQISTVLPAGLVGLIPSVALCGEPQASQGACPASSEIGTATVGAGAGSQPFAFSGPVYMTGPYRGAPFGLSIVTPTAAGPFNFGTIVTRAAISVDPTTARVSVTSDPLTRIVDGVPVRLRSISVTVDRSNFLLNPTSCGALSTDTALSSTFGATQALSSPFAVGNCGALGFSPLFAASTNADASKADGASLLSTVSESPGQANIHSVTVTLPAQLVTRLTTLQQACPEATYGANPASCPAGSNVGSASAITPTLPGVLSGPAYLVSHGGAAFPDLDLVLEGDGVRVILVGNTTIKAGAISTTFASLPDVPVSSFALSLPSGPHSALSANGELCPGPLIMPTTIIAQSGAQIAQSTKVSVAGCGPSGSAHGSKLRGVRIVRRKTVHHTLILTVQTFAAGRIRVGAKNCKTVSRRVSKASTIKLKIPLTRLGLSALHRHRKLELHVRVSFVPAKAGAPHSAATTRVTLRY